MFGKGVDVKSAATESFGKSFLLPIDIILGWFLLIIRDRVYLIK